MHGKLFTSSTSALFQGRLGVGMFVGLLLLLSTHLSWSQQTICFGSIKHYAVDTFENGGLGTSGSTYHWNVSGVNFLGNITPTVSGATNAIIIDWGNTPAGTYILKVNETNNGCSSLNQSLTVTVFPKADVTKPDQVACANPSTGNWEHPVIINTGLSSSQCSFIWHRDGILLPNTTSAISVNQIGQYVVTITNTIVGCQSNESTTVILSSAPKATATIDNSFEDSQNITVTAIGLGTYEYALDNGVFQDSPIFTVSQSGNYIVTVRDKMGCGKIDLPVMVIGFPKFFTPNGDGYNDTWNISSLKNQENVKIYIFNRYGKLIKMIVPSDQQGWDGTYGNLQLPADDYWFTVEYTEKTELQQFKSHFSLKR